MFIKGEINLGYIISTTLGVVLAGVVLHFIMKSKNSHDEAKVLTKKEETPAV
jgi:uncharacterized protein (UPF0333 family)